MQHDNNTTPQQARLLDIMITLDDGLQSLLDRELYGSLIDEAVALLERTSSRPADQQGWEYVHWNENKTHFVLRPFPQDPDCPDYESVDALPPSETIQTFAVTQPHNPKRPAHASK